MHRCSINPASFSLSAFFFLSLLPLLLQCCNPIDPQAAAETGGFDVCGAHATVEMRKPRRGRRERATVPEGTSTRSVSQSVSEPVALG